MHHHNYGNTSGADAAKDGKGGPGDQDGKDAQADAGPGDADAAVMAAFDARMAAGAEEDVNVAVDLGQGRVNIVPGADVPVDKVGPSSGSRHSGRLVVVEDCFCAHTTEPKRAAWGR